MANICASPLDVHEILLIVFCDDSLGLKDILRFEQVCKLWHDASNSWKVWQGLLRRLDDDHAPDLLPHDDINILTTQDTKDVVCRAHRKGVRWRSTSLVTPSSIREIPLAEIFDGNWHPCSTDLRYYTLLPGGRHALAHQPHPQSPALNFTIFEVSTMRRVWSHSDRLRVKQADATPTPISYAAAYSEEDPNVLIIVAVVALDFLEEHEVEDTAHHGNGTSRDGSFILVLQANVSTGSTEVLFRKSVQQPPDIEIEQRQNMKPATVLIREDYIVVFNDFPENCLLLLNYRTSRCTWSSLGSQGFYVQTMFMVDDALLIIAENYSEEYETVVTNLAVVEVNRVLHDAPHLESLDRHVPSKDFLRVISFRQLLSPKSGPLQILSIRRVKAHWRGEDSTSITVLGKLEDIAPHLDSPRYKKANRLMIFSFRWRPARAGGHLELISLEDIKANSHDYARRLLRLSRFSDMSSSGRFIGLEEGDDDDDGCRPVWRALDINMLQRNQEDSESREQQVHALPLIDAARPHSVSRFRLPRAFDPCSETFHFYSEDLKLLLYRFD